MFPAIFDYHHWPLWHHEPTVTQPQSVSEESEVQNGAAQKAAESVPGALSEEFPDGGYGWVVVAAVTLIQAHTFGFNSTFSVFLAYYLESDTFPGATPLELAFVGGLSFSIALFVAPLATATIRHWGTRTTFFLGIMLQTAAFIGASFTTQVWHLILSQGICFGIGMGFCYTSTTGLVPQWFKKYRALANGIAAGGTGFGGLIYTLSTNAMIHNVGLAWAFRILAIIGFIVLAVCGFLIKDRNKKIGSVLNSFDWSLFKRVEYCLFLAWAWFSSMGYIVVLFSIADYVETVGYSPSQASIAAAIFSLSTGVFRPVVGLFCDRFGNINVTAFSTLISALAAFFIWIFGGKAYAGAIIYSLLGVLTGVVWATFAPVAAQVVGIQLLPSAISITLMILVIPYTFSEPIGLSVRKPGKDGYLNAQVFVGVMFVIAFVCLWVLRIRRLEVLDAELNEENEKLAVTQLVSTECPVNRATAKNRPRPSSFRRYSKQVFAMKHL